VVLLGGDAARPGRRTDPHLGADPRGRCIRPPGPEQNFFDNLLEA
jgi:hypothetical protein